MNYKKPDNLSPERTPSIDEVKNANSFFSVDSISPWLRDEDPDKEPFVIERELFYEDDNWNSIQTTVVLEEIHTILERIEKHLEQDFGIQWAVLYTLNEIIKNSVDHAKSDAYIKLEVSETSEWILVAFIAADKGPGMKQHLINLFSNQEFIDRYSKNNKHREQIIKVITAESIDEYYQKHLSWKWVSTRIEHRGGALFGWGHRLTRAIDELWLDLIMRDRDYEHTFSNRGGYLSRDKIRDLPYNLVYYWAKILPKKI